MTPHRTPYFHTQVIGCGPGALGIAVAADRLKLLDTLLDQGIAFLEKAPTPKELFRQRFPFQIESNSVAEDFLKAIETEGIFAEVCKNENSRFVYSRIGSTLPLENIRMLMNDLTKAFLEKCCFSGTSGIFFGREIESIRLSADGTATTYGRSGIPIAQSRNVVIATGAVESLPAPDDSVDGGKIRYLPSSHVLSGMFSEVEEQIRDGRTIAILGGSHSAFSVAVLLLECFGSQFKQDRIRIYHKGVHLYFSSILEAIESGYSIAGAQIFRATGEVNKFHGLRGKAKELYQQVVSGRESRVQVRDSSLFPQRPHFTDAPILAIQAIGYRSRKIGLVDDAGAPIRVFEYRNCQMVDPQCRLLAENGSPIRNLYGIGIGHARLSENREFKIGVNFFHGPDGETIVHQIAAPARRIAPGPRPNQSSPNLNGVPN